MMHRTQKEKVSIRLFSRSVSVALVFAIACSSIACGKKEEKASAPPPAVAVKVTKVTRGDLPVYKEFVGQTSGAVDAEIRARVEGVVTALGFQEGKDVVSGQLLYSIDPAPYKSKVAQAQGKLAEAQTRLAKAESDLKRVKPLVAMKALSERDLDAAVAQEGTARASVSAEQAAVESAQIELSYCDITAPISGVIGLTKAKVGEFVGRSPNPVVLNTVSQLDPIHVKFPITEQDYLYFSRLQQKALDKGEAPSKRSLELILADGSSHTEKGETVSVGREIDPNTASLMIEASFPNPHKLIRPGQYAKVRTISETSTGVLLVPKRSIRDTQGQLQLFVVKDDNTVDARTVIAGSEVGDLRVIEIGVNEGESIVVEGVARVRSGSVVSPESLTD